MQRKEGTHKTQCPISRIDGQKNIRYNGKGTKEMENKRKKGIAPPRDSRRTRELEAEVRALRKQLAEKDEVIDVLKKSVGILSRP